MSDDLHALLARASGQIEGAAPDLDGGRLEWLRAAARRRRVVRRTAESFAGVGVVGVVGVALWIGVNHGTPEPVVPVVTPTVAPSITPTPAPAPAPTPTPTLTGPPVRAAAIDDETVIARLSAPRTGEVWQTPVRAPEVADLLLPPDSTDTPFLVGTRAGAAIYVTVAPERFGSADVSGLFEVDSAGTRLIACPSARTSDPCAPENTPTAAGAVRDEDTFYDTFTLPRSIDLGGGYTVTTTAATSFEYFPYILYGDGLPLVDDTDLRIVRPLGAMSLVTQELTAYGPQVTSFRYAVRTPFGSVVDLAAEDAPGGDFGSIEWAAGDQPVPATENDPGDSRGTRSSVSPGSPACDNATLSRDVDHVDSEWRQAGTTAQGRPVFVPVDGGNPLSRTVRAWEEQHSWGLPVGGSSDLVTGAAAGYPYLTDEAFLAAHALYAVQGPSGEWLLLLRGDAESILYECA